MKKLIIVVFALLAITSSKAQLVIGELRDGNAILTSDKGRLINAYTTNLLRASQIEARFTDVKITIINSSYYLIFSGERIKSAFLVAINANNILRVADVGISCTTSDCASEMYGCIPEAGGVLACEPCANKGKCTKTVSSSSLLE
ncbi:MAG: hypothetical protein WKF35_11190 [Ferruginibacter sp.]